jgi:hypothetical protein
MVSVHIGCIFWRRVGELFTTISKIYGIKADSLHILENGWGNHYLGNRWYQSQFIAYFGEGLGISSSLS